MKTWSKMLLRDGKMTECPIADEQADEREAILVLDIEKPYGVLRLRYGKWAGRTWAVRLHCCENPRCGCANVTFYCIDADRDSPEQAEMVNFNLDAMERTVTAETCRDDARYQSDFAKAAVAEFGEQEWQLIYKYLLHTKRNIVRTMDVAKVSLPDSPDDITEDGGLVWFGDLFPFADCFEFDLDGEMWAIDDQYCVMPDCDCREVVLGFLRLLPSRGRSNSAKDSIPSVRYDYKLDKIKVLQKPAVGHPSLIALLHALREAYPSFVENVGHRHEQLKVIYLRTVLAKGPPDATVGPGTTIRRDEPKVGRNDPCPCGSGKKYKKCCGR